MLPPQPCINLLRTVVKTVLKMLKFFLIIWLPQLLYNACPWLSFPCNYIYLLYINYILMAAFKFLSHTHTHTYIYTHIQYLAKVFIFSSFVMLLLYVNCFKLVFFFYISLHYIHHFEKAKTELSQLRKSLRVQLMKNGGKNKCCVYNFVQCIYTHKKVYIYVFT